MVGGDLVAITVHVQTRDWANEVTWSVDGSAPFGVDPTFEDNSDYYEVLTLPQGAHTLSYFDSYGDGWHGGYWEILPGAVTAETAAGVSAMAGGPVSGLVAGSGGTASFVLGVGGGGGGVSMCSSQCVRGFQCPDGWWWDDANGECVPTSADCP